MCEISKSQRRTYRDQDPPRIFNTNKDNNSTITSSLLSSSSSSSLGIVMQNEKEETIANSSEFFKKNHQQQQQQQKQRRDEASITTAEVAHSNSVDSVDSTAVSIGRDNVRSASGGAVSCSVLQENKNNNDNDDAIKKVPSTLSSSSSCIPNTSGKISNTKFFCVDYKTACRYFFLFHQRYHQLSHYL
ncbi:hypothetical protein PV327_004861 [Microctonus hyperodae]|uniref:Uncharacterized protein n=1 Tax=Microctonus hyperodae TaxID=165561 RepID=A0AA39FDH6_MICHY|nr:hypothetical protein PV327_004861 [Microctonus hyperodae]